MPTFEWDESKRAANLRKHGIDFGAVERFDLTTAMERDDYDEITHGWRTVALGLLDNNMNVLVYT